MADLLADTYAIMSVLKGSKRYQKLLDKREAVTTRLNIAEAAVILLRSGNATEATLDDRLSPFAPWVLDGEAKEVPREAAIFQHGMVRAKRDCSIVDAWGYATARSLKLPFLTGDESFRGTPHVEFLKE